MLNLRSEFDVVRYMSEAVSEADWNKRLDEVIKANGGYPSFWFPAILATDLHKKTAAKWGGDGEIHIENL